MQRDIERADDVLYTLFNELNDEDQFDVLCGYETQAGTRVRTRVCKSNFERGVMHERAVQ